MKYIIYILLFFSFLFPKEIEAKNINIFIEEKLAVEYAQGALANTSLWTDLDVNRLARFREVYMDFDGSKGDSDAATEINTAKNLTLTLWKETAEDWAWWSSLQIATGLGSELQANTHFYDFDRWAPVDDVVYGGLDVVGLIPGVDTFADPIGAVYATARGDGTNAVIVIYIHHLAQKESQQEFLQALNYASTFLGIYGSSRILFTKGAGYLAKAIAFTELANLTMGVYMQNEANVNYLRSIGSEGEWFVNNWTTISIATDLTTFSTSFLTNLSRNAGKVSQKIRVKGATQEADELEDLIKSSGTVLEKRSKVLSMGNIGAKYPINDFEGFVENTFTITQKERFHKAKEFYKSFNSDFNVNELRGIDFDSNVSNILKQEDNVMYQLATIDKNTGKPRVGQYFFENIDDDVSKLGIGDLNRIKADKRVKIKVIFDEGVNFLKSKTADIEDWTGSGEIFKGGGTQYYSSTAKTKIKSYEIIEVY